MENELLKFRFEGQIVRVADRDNQYWWLAKDVCNILGLQNTSQALNGLDDDEKLIYTLHISGQTRNVWMVNEPGLYSLVMRSNKPQAREFKRWVTHEVLPMIREFGFFEYNGGRELAGPELGELLGIHPNTVSRYARILGMTRRPGRPWEFNRKEALDFVRIFSGFRTQESRDRAKRKVLEQYAPYPGAGEDAKMLKGDPNEAIYQLIANQNRLIEVSFELIDRVMGKLAAK